MSDIVIDIAARHAEDEAAGPFVGRRSEQARLDRGALLAEIERLCEERRSITTLLGKVESLEADNERLREERRWIPVGERVPEKYQSVLVAFTPDSRGVVEVCEAVHYFGSDFETDKGCYECSHWMPLPSGPEANG